MFESQAFFDNSYEHINGHGDPDLGLDAAVRSAEKVFDAQMLFDPFEEEFDLNCPIGYQRPRKRKGRDEDEQSKECLCAAFGRGISDGEALRRRANSSTRFFP